MCAGYKTITPIKLLNGVSAYQSKLISFKALRVYVACFELQAIREAARRTKQQGRGNYVLFQKAELVAATGGLSKRSIGQSLSQLKKAELLVFNERSLTFTDTPIKSAIELIEGATGGRKATRPIPVPRRLLKYLAKINKPALFVTLIAYILRGLSFDKHSGEIKNKGTVKASFIAEVFGISLRAVKGARAFMIGLGIISKDENSYQRKLNRDGTYFALNFEWRDGESKEASMAEPVDNSSAQNTGFAPPRPEKRTESAPPYKRLKTSNEVKDQKTSSGACTLAEDAKAPNLNNIQLRDLKRSDRISMLFAQAQDLASHTESSRLHFFASAAHALRVGHDPIKLFSWSIRQRHFGFISSEDEERARAHMKQSRIETRVDYSPPKAQKRDLRKPVLKSKESLSEIKSLIQRSLREAA